MILILEKVHGSKGGGGELTKIMGAGGPGGEGGAGAQKTLI